MLLCGMNFINLTHIQFIFGIEDQLILSYNPKPEDISLSAKRHLEPYERSAVVVRESVSV